MDPRTNTFVPYGTKTNKAVFKGLRPGKENLYENVSGTQKTNKQTNEKRILPQLTVLIWAFI